MAHDFGFCDMKTFVFVSPMKSRPNAGDSVTLLKWNS